MLGNICCKRVLIFFLVPQSRIECLSRHATCKRWFQRFRDNDFDVRNEESEIPPNIFEDLNESQMETRNNTYEILLQTHERKSVLHRTVTGAEKYIYFKNPKWRKSWVNPGQLSTSTIKKGGIS